jgi:two-component system, OmpR family, response regulator
MDGGPSLGIGLSLFPLGVEDARLVTILLVDEDDAWRTRAAAALYRRGFDVMSQSDRWRIAEMLDETAPDLVVLYAETPAQDARFSKLLAQWPPPPRLLLLCPNARLGERAASVAAGAADCLPKPDDPEALCGLIEQVLPSLAPQAGLGEAVEFDGWRLFPRLGRLVAPMGAWSVLVPGDLRLLRAFLDHRGRVLSRAQLHRSCGLDDRITENVVDCRVSRLRRTLRRLDPGSQGLIRTVRGEGYVFVRQGERREKRS